MNGFEALSAIGTTVSSGLVLLAILVIVVAGPLVYITVLGSGPSHKRLRQFMDSLGDLLESFAKVVEAWRSGRPSRRLRDKEVPPE
jgi:choline-glycine betaine transporter